jgi:hypothetical protein
MIVREDDDAIVPGTDSVAPCDTYRRRDGNDQLPEGAMVEAESGLRVKGKADAVHAYVLLALPA